MKSFQAILFDLEGTIIDTETIWDECGKEFLRRHDRVYDRALTKHLLLGRTLPEGAAIMQKQYNFDGDPQVLGAERRTIFQELIEDEVKFMPGFTDFFARIKPSYPVAIATSLEHAFIKAIDHKLHLADLFGEHIYSIDDVGHIGKPSPDIFLYAAKKLSTDPEVCLVIEDAPNGVEAAHRAGMKVVALTATLSADHLKDADQIVDHFSEITLV